MPSNLSPYQLAIQSAVGKGKGAHTRITPELLGRIADSTFGPAPVPPGSQIISQDAATVRWIDPEGFEHVATRDLNGTNPNVGQWDVRTNRPAVLPQSGASATLPNQLSEGMGGVANAQLANARALAEGRLPAALDPGIAQYLDQITKISAGLAGPVQLAQLDPATRAGLDAQSAAEVAALNQQFEDARGQVVAGLYGNRVNQSSIANDAVARLLQQQGLVRQRQQADAALRAIQVQLTMTEEERARQAAAIAGLTNAAGAQLQGFATTQGVSQSQVEALNALLRDLTGQQTQREIAGAQISLGRDELAERARGTNLNFELGQQDADTRLAEQNSLLNKFLKGSQIVSNLAGAASGGLSAYSALTRPRGGA